MFSFEGPRGPCRREATRTAPPEYRNTAAAAACQGAGLTPVDHYISSQLKRRCPLHQINSNRRCRCRCVPPVTAEVLNFS